MRHYVERVLFISEAASGTTLFESPVAMASIPLEHAESDRYAYGMDGYPGSAIETADGVRRYSQRG
jgi:hypothetical protein